MVLWVGLPGFIIAIVLGVLAYRYLVPFYDRAQEYDLSEIDNVELPSIIFDRNGKELGRMYVENRSVISIDQMSSTLISSLIAQEDKRFWTNRGVDWKGLIRMAWLNLKAGEVTQGASTITMQLARNAFNLKAEALERGEGGKERKLVEIFLAHRIGKKYSSESGKKYILENYLNRVPFGHGYYGARSASLGFFGKEPKDLNWEEAATMVTCIKNPTAFSPIRHPERNKKGRDHVFRRLNQDGAITRKEYKRLKKLPIKTDPKPLRRGTSHLYEKIGLLAREIVGEDAMSQGGYRIYTTIDVNMQRVAEESLREGLDSVEALPGFDHPRYLDFDPRKGNPKYLQGALLVNDPYTGEVLAHVGGRDYRHTQFDFIDAGKRPLGTANFPFLYALALDSGYNTSSHLKDEAIDNRMVMVGGREGILGEWGPEVLNPVYEGEISLRSGLERSKVAATVRLGRSLGIEKFAEFSESFGFDYPEKDDLLARDLLGWVPVSLYEASRAYSSFAAAGKVPEKLLYIQKIENSEGLLVHLTGTKDLNYNSRQVIGEDTAFLVDNILRGVTEGSGNLADRSKKLIESGFQGGAKTGTTYNFSDSWAFGYNDYLVCSSWVGFQQGNRGPIVKNGFAKDVAFPIVKNFIPQIDNGLRGSLPKRPETIIKKEICKVSGLLATRYCFNEVTKENGEVEYISTAYNEFFKAGHEPEGICPVHTGGASSVSRYAPTKGVTAAKPVLSLDPVKPKSAVVVGNDPYGAVENSSENEDAPTLTGVYGSGLLILNDEVEGEAEASIVMPRPRRLRLRVDPSDLNPIVLKAIVVD